MDSYNTSKASNRSLLLTGLTAFVSFFLLWAVFLKPASTQTVHKAIAVLTGDSKVTGTVYFEQSSKDGPVTVRGELKDLNGHAKHGFHIHALGDATNGCLSSGSHFNPFSKTHGAPTDSERHVGDLGNIQTDGNGIAQILIEDSLISLNGPLSIVGRTVVVHAGTDDLGRGDNEESLKTGNAGARAACGVIGLAELV